MAEISDLEFLPTSSNRRTSASNKPGSSGGLGRTRLLAEMVRNEGRRMGVEVRLVGVGVAIWGQS